MNNTEVDPPEINWETPAPDGETRRYTQLQIEEACNESIANTPGYQECAGAVDVEGIREECILDCYVSTVHEYN